MIIPAIIFEQQFSRFCEQVRDGLLEESARAGIDPVRWCEKQIGKLGHAHSPNAAEIETLKLIRDGLQAKSSKGKGKRKRTRARSAR